MSLIVAGRFDTFAKAQEAAQHLFEHGFKKEDVTLFFVNPPGQHHHLVGGGDQIADADSKFIYKGASIGAMIGAVCGASIGTTLCAVFKLPLLITVISAAVGAYIGSLIGAMNETQNPKPGLSSTKMHQSGVLLAIHVTTKNQADATSVLQKTDAKDIERAHGNWEQGSWSDFDPLQKPSLVKKQKI